MDSLFNILTKSSPTRLFKFKFQFYSLPELKALKLFFDNWKGRHPMLLYHIDYMFIPALEINSSRIEYNNLIENYIAAGTIKYEKCYNNWYKDFFEEDFEWF